MGWSGESAGVCTSLVRGKQLQRAVLEMDGGADGRLGGGDVEDDIWERTREGHHRPAQAELMGKRGSHGYHRGICLTLKMTGEGEEEKEKNVDFRERGSINANYTSSFRAMLEENREVIDIC